MELAEQTNIVFMGTLIVSGSGMVYTAVDGLYSFNMLTYKCTIL